MIFEKPNMTRTSQTADQLDGEEDDCDVRLRWLLVTRAVKILGGSGLDLAKVK